MEQSTDCSTLFKGKVIIMSGAAGAIGSSAASLLSSSGANLVVADLDEEKAKKTGVGDRKSER